MGIRIQSPIGLYYYHYLAEGFWETEILYVINRESP